MLFVKEKKLKLTDWLWVLVVFLVMNALITGIGAYAMANGEPSAPSWATDSHPMMLARDRTSAKESVFSNLFINNWYRWDTGWYLKIASLGYAVDDNSTGFQPLYPFLIKALNAIGVNYLMAALLISRISCLVAIYLLFKITLDLYHSEQTARRTALILLTFPAAFFLFVGYTEALTLALSLACFYFLTKNMWLLSGIAGGLAAMTRIQAIVIVVPMLWIALSGRTALYPVINLSATIQSIKERMNWLGQHIVSKQTIIPVFSSVLPVIFIGAYSIYLKVSGFETIAGAYANRGTRVVMPWIGLWDLGQRLLHNRMAITDYIEIGLFILFTIAFLIGIKELPVAFSLYNLAMIAIILMRVYEVSFLPGFMRYMLIIFPIFIVFGKKLQNRWAFYTAIAGSLVINLLMAWSFVNWFWVA